ncbi:MAG: class I SAM-dependent methyltransferase [Oligoflexia bacterium]|nr:class I SAM-dependent methyltransferase [Oligoflexia bacterium]MBF0367587.1 class I SAM-dependent methyltransferase [Oligoflexia bacterium]
MLCEKCWGVLHGTLSGINLVGHDSIEEFFAKQILDSIAPLYVGHAFRTSIERSLKLVDVGTGGGFPLLPLASEVREAHFLGIDSKRKKVEAVELMARELKLDHVKSAHKRLEDIVIDCDCTITVKAVGKCLDILDFVQLKDENLKVEIYFYKGQNFKELEGRDANKIAKRFELIEECEYSIPSYAEKRFLVGYRPKKIKSKPFLNKTLVNLSHFF